MLGAEHESAADGGGGGITGSMTVVGDGAALADPHEVDGRARQNTRAKLRRVLSFLFISRSMAMTDVQKTCSEMFILQRSSIS
jgi:hypothetical protein